MFLTPMWCCLILVRSMLLQSTMWLFLFLCWKRLNPSRKDKQNAITRLVLSSESLRNSKREVLRCLSPVIPWKQEGSLSLCLLLLKKEELKFLRRIRSIISFWIWFFHSENLKLRLISMLSLWLMMRLYRSRLGF